MKTGDVRRIELRAGPGGGGEPLSTADIEWPWLLPPVGFEHREMGNAVVRVWPAAPATGIGYTDPVAGEVPDAYFGTIPLVARRPGERMLDVVRLHYPPPPPFDWRGGQQMWDDVRAFGLGLPEAVRAQGRLDGGGVPAGLDASLNYEFWAEAFDAACSLWTNWPARAETVRTRVAVASPGGMLDLPRTDSEIGVRIPLIGRTGRALPERTVRRRHVAAPAAFAAVGLLTEHLLDVMLKRCGLPRNGTALAPLTPFISIAETCRAARGTIDPPMSSWPRRVRRYYVAATALLTALQTDTEGQVPPPLCDFWRLYEEWVGTMVFLAVVSALGAPTVPPTLRRDEPASGGLAYDWRAEWRLDGGRALHLVAKPRFDATPRPVVEGQSTSFLSVSSVLVPDLVLAEVSPVRTIIRVLDAKKRAGRGGGLASSDAAEAASKYLWGLRDWAKPDVPGAVHSVSLISSLPGGPMHDAVRARIKVQQLLPGTGATVSLDGLAPGSP